MKTTFDILDILFPIVNVASVTTTITGSVYRDKKDLNLQSQDIVVLTLPINNKLDVSEVMAIVNIFCKKYDNGRPNETVLIAATDAVIAVIEAYDTSSTDNFFRMRIQSQSKPIDDYDDNQMSYVSIRIKCNIENV